MKKRGEKGPRVCRKSELLDVRTVRCWIWRVGW